MEDNGLIVRCISELLCVPTTPFEQPDNRRSKQSCWPPTSKKTLAWHCHSQLPCLSSKIHATAHNSDGPEPEHIRSLTHPQLGPALAPAAATTALPSALTRSGCGAATSRVCQPLQLPSAETTELGMKGPAGVRASTLLVHTWLLIRSPLMTQWERCSLVCAAVG